jgi:hypothetical protein
MSRTRKGAKGPGHEYWGKRRGGGFDPGRDSKRAIHGLERADAKEEVRAQAFDLNVCFNCAQPFNFAVQSGLPFLTVLIGCRIRRCCPKCFPKFKEHWTG